MQNTNSIWAAVLFQTEIVSHVLNCQDEHFDNFKALLWKHIQGKEVIENNCC